MKRTIIYVFGPKRLAHQYNEGNNTSKLQDVCDVTNWLKIGLTTTEDDTLDKWDAAEKRISQESRTGLNEPCVILDVFEYPYIEGKPDDVVRRLMTDDVYNFANSRANNGLIVNKYEIKAGQEFVYGASRSHVLAAIAKFERNLILRKCPQLESNDEKMNEFVNLIKMIQSNMDDASDEQEDTSSNLSPQVSTEVDAFYWKLIDAMPGYIKEKCNHTNGKNYMTIRTRRSDCKWYYLAFSVKRNSTSIQLETYGGAEDRDKVNSYIEETITFKGLLRPAMLMSHVRLNIYFYGRKFVDSGLYVVTKEVDEVGINGGFRTTLSLLRIGKSDLSHLDIQ